MRRCSAENDCRCANARIDANGLALAHVYGEPEGAIAASDSRLTNDEACRISKLITRLPELVELEQQLAQAATAAV